MNFKNLYLGEGFLNDLCPCSILCLRNLGVIPRTKNRFVEIVAVAERYLIMTHVKKYRMKEAVVPNMPSCKIS